jgi:hypothetical protein
MFDNIQPDTITKKINCYSHCTEVIEQLFNCRADLSLLYVFRVKTSFVRNMSCYILMMLSKSSSGYNFICKQYGLR